MRERERFFESKFLAEDFLAEYDQYFTYFLVAIRQNNQARIDQLLSESDATSRRKNFETNETVLHLAVRFGSISLINRIIELGTDINAQDKNGETPLHRAIGRSAEIVRILLDNGADVEIYDDWTVNPLQRSLLSGSIETVCLLMRKKYSIELCSNQENAPQNDFEKCSEIVKNYLALSIDLFWDVYPILVHFAAKYGDEETLKLALKESKCIDFDAFSPEEQGLIHVVADAGRSDSLKIILDYGADVNESDNYEFTPLYYALMQNNSTIVRLLLDHGADVNHRSDSEIRPITYALRYCTKDIVEMLINSDVHLYEANPGQMSHLTSSLFTACGLTRPLNPPLIYLNQDEYLMKNEYSQTEYWCGCSLEIIKLLLEKGADVNAQTIDEKTPLLVACNSGRFDIVQILLEFGADLHERALVHAVDGANIEIVSFLIEKDFDVNARFTIRARKSGFKYTTTPIHSIFGRFNEKSNVELIEILADNGAIFEGPHPGGLNIIIKAIYNQKPEEVVCLLELNASIQVPIKIRELSPYSGLCCSRVMNRENPGESMSLRQFTAFLALKEKDISLYAKREYLNYEPESHPLSIRNQFDESIFLYHEKFFQECKLETEKLKSTKICYETIVSYFDFLTEELLVVVAFTRSEQLMQVLESQDYKEEFPCYTFLLEQRIERVKKLRTYVDMIEEFLEKEYAKRPLPWTALKKIFRFWSIGEVRNFGRALSMNKK